MYMWRIRITESQGFPYSKGFDPEIHERYTAARFFEFWISQSFPAFSLDGPHNFDGGSAELPEHLGWTLAP